jgi:hypothetical protein
MNMMSDLLNGAHGKFLERNQARASTYYLRNKIQIAMSVGGTQPTQALSQHKFLNLYGNSYYTPYLMFEQLPPRISDFTVLHSSFQAKNHQMVVQFDLVDHWRMSNMQDQWLSYMDYVCGDTVPTFDSKMMHDSSFIQKIVFLTSLTIASMQILTNIVGIFS